MGCVRLWLGRNGTYTPSFSLTVAYRELASGHDCLLQKPVTLYSLRQKFWVEVLTLYEQNWVFITDQMTSSLCMGRNENLGGGKQSLVPFSGNAAMSFVRLRPVFAHCPPWRRGFHFDTHAFVQRLEREGSLTRPQAEAIMNALTDVIDESIRNMTRNMVTKAEQEKVRNIPFVSEHHLNVNCSTTTPNKSTFLP